MKAHWRALSVLSIFAAGYLVGSGSFFSTPSASGQVDKETGLSEQTQERVLSALQSMQAAASTLENEGKFRPANRGLNAFATSVGGVDAMGDLQKFYRVDPETFAALYAGYAADEILIDVARDEEGRVTYKGKVVRMYSVERLKELFERRNAIANPE